MSKITGDQLLEAVYRQEIEQKKNMTKDKIKVGVDLGTSSIVIVVLNEENLPLACFSEDAQVVRDGLVVNFFEASKILERLKYKAEELVGRDLLFASGAIPPQTGEHSQKAVAHVMEAAGFEVDQVVDEPYAAAQVLEVHNGGVVDIGGGTTGISVFEGGEQVFSADEATGGYHMSLVLSGYYKISLEDAEKHKRNPQKYEEHFQVLYPVAEKMAHLSQRFIQQYGKPVELVYLVGGTTVFPQFKDVFQKVLGIPVYQPFHPRLVTPVGIAMLSKEF